MAATGPKGVPWKKIRAEYVTTQISYRDLAEKWDVSFTTLSRRGTEEGWVRRRKEYEEKTLKKALQKATEKQAEKLSAELIAAEKASAEIINIALGILTDPGQFQRHLVKLRHGYGEGAYTEELAEEERTVIDARRLRDIATALETATKLSRTLKGILDEPVKQKLDIEREKLEIDRTKAGLGDEDEEGTGIVVLPDLAEVDEEEGIELGTIDLDSTMPGGSGGNG